MNFDLKSIFSLQSKEKNSSLRIQILSFLILSSFLNEFFSSCKVARSPKVKKKLAISHFQKSSNSLKTLKGKIKAKFSMKI
jgi:hypothetical protein